jgi:hypothetical protein
MFIQLQTVELGNSNLNCTINVLSDTLYTLLCLWTYGPLEKIKHGLYFIYNIQYFVKQRI